MLVFLVEGHWEYQKWGDLPYTPEPLAVMIFALLYMFVFGFATIYIAIMKNKEPGCSWFFLGAILGPLGVLMALFMKTEKLEETENAKSTTKECPYCKETVKAGAMICPYCQSTI